MLAMTACTTATDPASPPAPSTAVQGSAQGGAPSAEELRRALLLLGDVALSEMDRLGGFTRPVEADPETRAFIGAVRADLGTTATVLAVEPDAEAALEALLVSTAAKRLAAASPEGETIAPEARAAVLQSLTRVEKTVWDEASRWYAPAELDELRRDVARWWSDAPDRSAAGVIRPSDVADGDAVLSKGLFSPIREANQQLVEARQLGERFLFVVERLPTISVWQAEAAAWNAAMTPETRRALSDLSVMVAAMESLAADVERMPLVVAEEREAFLAAFDGRTESMGGLIGETRAAMVDAEPLVASGVELATLADATSSNLAESLATMERLLDVLRDESAPGGAVSLDVESYAAVVADLNRLSESLNGSLAQIEGLSGTPTAVIDRAAWRAAQLLLLAFFLMLAYRILGRRYWPKA